MDLKYQVQLHFNFKPARKNRASGWPATLEENTQRLQSAGTIEDRGIIFCSNCDSESTQNKLFFAGS
jgi:hypothetical protein